MLLLLLLFLLLLLRLLLLLLLTCNGKVVVSGVSLDLTECANGATRHANKHPEVHITHE